MRKTGSIARMGSTIILFGIALIAFAATGMQAANEGGKPTGKSNERVYIEPVTEMKFLWIDAGEFVMGSSDEEPGRLRREKQHKVTLTQGFWIGRYEVTIGQFQKFVEAMGYRTDAEKELGAIIHQGKKSTVKRDASWRNPYYATSETQPVVCVSWNDAKAMIDWLNSLNHGLFRLPSEAEWEYACRAKSTTARYWGNNPDEACRYENVNDKIRERLNRYAWFSHNCNDSYVKTAPVGSFKPNAFGLFDMIGNVSEWCSDRYGDYPSDPVTDPTGPAEGSYRVYRGGSWYEWPGDCRSANREAASPVTRNDNLGFRLVKSLR